MQIINQITATSCKFWMWKYKWGCYPGIPISGLAGPGSMSQNASMYVELLKEDLCDPQMWMKAEMRRWRWGHFRRMGLPEQSPDLWCGLTVRDDSRAFEMEEEERVESLLFLSERSHTAASGIRSNEHPCKNFCCALQALFLWRIIH